MKSPLFQPKIKYITLVIWAVALVRNANAQQPRTEDSTAQIKHIAASVHINDNKAREIYSHFSTGRREMERMAKEAQDKRFDDVKRNLQSRRTADSLKTIEIGKKAASDKLRRQQVKGALQRATETKVTPKSDHRHEQ